MNVRLNKVLVLILVLALMSTTVYGIPNKSNGIGRENAPGQVKKGDFNDTEGFWAERYIERMAKKDVIKGVGNGAFMPGNTAKEIETIIMLLRLIDSGFDEVEDFGNNSELPEDYKGKKPEGWMVPYIEKGYDEGLITEKDFDPNFPTKRSKAAVYFVRAAAILGENPDLIDEAEKEDNTKMILPYNDFNSIPEEHIGYVYVADALGLIEGYPNGTFQGNKAINRAELAAMMARLDGDYENDYSYSLEGKIEKIDLDGDTDQITLKVKGNEPTFELSTEVSVYIDDAKATLDDLAVNMIVTVEIYNNQIIEISFRSDGQVDNEKYEGEITSLLSPFDEITIKEDGDYFTFNVTSETTIEVKPNVLGNELIEEFVGLNAKIEADNTTATSIWIELNKVEGILIGINTSGEAIVSVDVQLDESPTDTFEFYEDFEICIDEVEGDLTDEYLGHIVEMKLLGNKDIVTLCVVTEVNTEDLDTLIVEANDLDVSNYTTDTVVDFEAALTSAEAIQLDDYPTQDQVNTAYNNLKDAMDSFIATVTDLIVTDTAIVTDLDSETNEVKVAPGTTVGALITALDSEFDAELKVLSTSGGDSLTDDVVVAEYMVLEVTAKGDIVVEYSIIVEE